MTSMIAAFVAGYSLVDILIAIVIIAAAVGIMFIALKVFVAILAIRFVASL